MHFPPVKFMSCGEDLYDLSPLQNRWLKKYTKPSVAVTLSDWGKRQPQGFDLRYLLQHAMNNHWDLTEEGWSKAEELGLLDTPLANDNGADREDDECWLTHTEAVRQLLLGTDSQYSEGSLKTRLSKMADKGQIKTNGEKRRNRRFSKSAIDSLELKLRNELLDEDEDD